MKMNSKEARAESFGMPDEWYEYHKIREKLFSHNNPIQRPSWADVMMDLAFRMSKRSHDAQTQHGSVICNDDNEIITTGYNGFMRGIDDSLLPNVRPEKYEFMIHSEISAILTCARQGRPTKGMTIYVTGMPCLRCLQYIHQAGIKKVIYGNHTSHMQQSAESQIKSRIVVELSGLDIEEYVPSDQISQS